MSTKKQPIAPCSENDAKAIKALFTGTATENQQIAALNCIMNDLCKFFSPETFSGEDTHATAFMLGRRQVWLDLMLIKNSDIQ